MGKSEKLVVLGVLFFVVLLFVWSLQSDGSSLHPEDSGVQASERDPVTAPRMDGRAPREQQPAAGKATQGAERLDERSLKRSAVVDSDVAARDASSALRGGTASTRMLLAETQTGAPAASAGGGAIEVSSSTTRRRQGRGSNSSLADPAARGAAEGATTRSGLSRARVRMQPGWDLITTAGLQGTVDPSMFLYEVSKDGATWESLAKDLYGDASKAGVLRHNNEGMTSPKGPIFVPAKDELGVAASVRTVVVLQGESLWQVAKRTLGKGSEWKAVWEANRDVIPDPDLVAPGTVLRIPVR